MTPLLRIARLSAAFLGSNLARAAIGFGLSFALARGLGAEGFGRWILCTAWGSTLTVVADLGFGVLLTRDGAREDAEIGRLLIGALMSRLALALPLAVLLYAGAGLISSDTDTISGLRLAAMVGAAGAAYGCFGALLRSQPRWLPAVLAVETGWLAIQLAAAWWLVGRRAATPDIAALMALALVVQLAQIVSAMVCWRAVFGERGRVRPPSLTAWLTLLRRAVPFAAAGIVANLQTRIGPLMLGYLSTASELGLFAAASRFGNVVRLVPQAVFAGALPVLSHEHARDRLSAERVFRTFDMLLLGAAVAVAAGCALFAAPVLRLVYGASFVQAAPALLWVGIGLVPLLSNSGRKIFLYASGAEARVVRWSTIGVMAQVAFGALLIPALGGVGVAVSLGAAETVIWWPLRQAVPTAIAADRADSGEILCT